MKKLSAVHIHFFKRLIFLLLATISTLVMAAGDPLTAEDKAIAEMAKSIRAQSKDWALPVNQYQAEANRQAASLLEELKKPMAENIGLPDKPKPGGRVIFFVSFSMGSDGLEDVLETASTTPDSIVVFRGIRDEKNFAKSITEMQSLAAKQTPIPNVIIDPTLFRDYNVKQVPTIILLDDDKTKDIARVSGLSNPSWLLSKVDSGHKGDFGVMGDVVEIYERDLIEVMKEKAASIDWEKKKEAAIKRFWERQQFNELPRAARSRIRTIDPSILITDDIRDADGKTIVAKGTKINPLEKLPFTQALVVFDPLDEKQTRAVDDRLKQLREKYSRITLIVTRFDRTDGWKSYKNITDHFDMPVFNLTNDVRSRFDIQYVPSIVSSESLAFRVEEIAVNEDDKK